MSYYKSENPQEQIDEAIQYLRQSVASEYSRKETGNSEYRENKEQLRAQVAPTLKLNLNLKDKVFHPSQHRYELSQLARAKDGIRQKNETLIDANPRVELAEIIRKAITKLDTQEAPVAVFAIEQLLQETDKIGIANYTSRSDFDAELHSINIGIRKLMGAPISKMGELDAKSNDISKQFDTNYDKHMYSNDIATKATTQFGENSQAVARLKYIHDSIMGKMVNAKGQLSGLKSEVLEELERSGIITGLDTGAQTFWKNFKAKVKGLLDRVLHKNEVASLPEGITTSNEQKSSFKNEISNMDNYDSNTQQFQKEVVTPEIEEISAADGR